MFVISAIKNKVQKMNKEQLVEFVNNHPMKGMFMPVEQDAAEINVEGIIAIAIGLFVCAILLPIAMAQLNAVNTTAWGETDIMLWGLIGTVAILSIVIGIVKMIKS